jgi:AcrR family transcriptional regulator
MPYRATERTEARRAQAREAILRSAHELIAQGGYRAASISAVAERAGVATGTVYRHYGSKAELFAEVFRRASQREVDAMAEAAKARGAAGNGAAAEAGTATEAGAAGDGATLARLAAGVDVFARRALRGRRLAWALLAEPVDPAVEAERLAFRRAYRDVLAAVLAAGVAAGELPDQDPELAAAALVGAIGEALVGPLSPAGPDVDEDALVAGLTAFCLRSVTDQEIADVRSPRLTIQR